MISEKKSPVIDVTSASIKLRNEYIELAKETNLPIRLIHIKVPIEVAMERN